jgi:hypothetical protein
MSWDARRWAAFAPAIACACMACGGRASSDASGALDASVEASPGPLDAGGDGDGHATGASDASTEPGPCESPAPTFSPPDGTSFQLVGTVTIMDVGLPAAGVIYYTTDGTSPSPNSKVYGAPIQISQNTTFRAVAVAPGCSNSNVVTVSYTVTPNSFCEAPPVMFVTPSETQPNDLSISLSFVQPGTICFTEDGSPPTCNSGTCTGTSQTYDYDAGVSINGSVTDVKTGQVTVTAVGCGYCCGPDFPCGSVATTPPQSEVYTLQADPPTLAGLDGGAGADGAVAFTPTIQSITVTSANPVDVATIHYTTDGGLPTCTTGQVTANPTTFNASGAPSLPSSGVELQALTCKPGYAPSAVATWSW